MRNKFGVSLALVPDPCTFSSPGSDLYLIRELRTAEDGSEYLAVTGRQSVSEAINAWRDMTDMSYIMSRLAAGDATVLAVNDGFYGDFSDMPHDHRAVLDTITTARQYFDNLPDSVRAKFDDDFVKWFSEAGDPAWVDKMVKNPDPEPAPVVDDSPEGGSAE